MHKTREYPKPTIPEPDQDMVADWILDVTLPEATDGCTVEPDGTCPHGHPSWLLVLGYV